MVNMDLNELSESLGQLNQSYKTRIGSDEGSDVLLSFCKKERRNFQTRFRYFKASHQDEATELFEDILKENLDVVSKSELSTDLANENPHVLTVIDLTTIPAWQDYEEGLNITNPGLEDLNILKRQLNSYIIAYGDEEVTIGQIRRITAKKVLTDNHPQKAYYNNNTFDSVGVESDCVEIDDEYDIFFVIRGEERIGLVKDLDMFAEIFDLDEETQINAINIINSSNIMELCDDSREILSFVERDRNIQYMLRNSLTCEGISNINIHDLEAAKTRLGDIVTFDITDSRIILDSDDKKKSVIHLLKAAGYRYNHSLFNDLILEGIPQKKMNG